MKSFDLEVMAYLLGVSNWSKNCSQLMSYRQVSRLFTHFDAYEYISLSIVLSFDCLDFFFFICNVSKHPLP